MEEYMDTTTLSPAILAACEIAATDGTPPDEPREIRAAYKDYNARGRCREHWFRMVWRGGAWQYLGDRRLASGNFRASERHDMVMAEVWPGELVVQHDRGGPIDAAYLVYDGGDRSLARCDLGRTRDGQLRITLPDGRQVVRPNPRRS
jgi:hypothetical protein